MPELPEVEVIARGLARSVIGKRITSVDPLWPTSVKGGVEHFVSMLEQSEITDVSRRAKLLILSLRTVQGTEAVLVTHLKMTGRMVVRAGEAPVEKHDRVVLHLDTGEQLVFADMRRFGYLAVFFADDLIEWKFYKNLGPEPLEMNVEDFVERFHGRRSRIKALLLDQQMVAGVGNIYADESLFRAGIRPQTPASRISKKRLKALFGHLQDVLRQAIQENGSSIRNYRDSGGNAGAFQNSFQAYGRHGQPCVNCAQVMKKIVVAGRTSTYCPSCQK